MKSCILSAIAMIPFRHHHLLQLLYEHDESRLPLDRLMHDYFKKNKSLGSKDRAFVADTAYGLVRWKGLLDYLGNTDWESRLETYLNGFKANSDCPPHIRVSFPKALYQRIEKSWGDQVNDICSASNTQAPITLRANTLKTTRKELIDKLEGAVPSTTTDSALTLKQRMPLFSLDIFKEGWFEMQDEASQQVAALVAAKPGEQVLDYCSGSGGKTLAFAPQLAGKGQIYLHDIRPSILQEAKRRLKRAGIQNAQIVTSDKLSPLKKRCDWVLADVPCSGTGTLRRNPDMKWRYTDEMVDRLVGEQRHIFERALSFVKPGGHIVYATCSILKEENGDQLNHFINTYGLKLCAPPLETLPTEGGMDGFFGAVLIKE